jgi:hypothetical protein
VDTKAVVNSPTFPTTGTLCSINMKKRIFITIIVVFSTFELRADCLKFPSFFNSGAKCPYIVMGEMINYEKSNNYNTTTYYSMKFIVHEEIFGHLENDTIEIYDGDYDLNQGNLTNFKKGQTYIIGLVKKINEKSAYIIPECGFYSVELNDNIVKGVLNETKRTLTNIESELYMEIRKLRKSESVNDSTEKIKTATISQIENEITKLKDEYFNQKMNYKEFLNRITEIKERN